MAEKPTDSISPLSVEDADEFVGQVTLQRMNVVRAVDGKSYLTHIGKRFRVHLLPYQLTRRGLLTAVAENDPWPGP